MGSDSSGRMWRNTDIISTKFRGEYVKWRAEMKNVRWDVYELPVSVHADVVVDELRGMLTDLYREGGTSFTNASARFFTGVLASLIARLNREAWDRESRAD